MEEFSEVARRVLRQYYGGEISADHAMTRLAGHLRRFDNVGIARQVPTNSQRTSAVGWIVERHHEDR